MFLAHKRGSSYHKTVEKSSESFEILVRVTCETPPGPQFCTAVHRVMPEVAHGFISRTHDACKKLMRRYVRQRNARGGKGKARMGSGPYRGAKEGRLLELGGLDVRHAISSDGLTVLTPLANLAND